MDGRIRPVDDACRGGTTGDARRVSDAVLFLPCADRWSADPLLDTPVRLVLPSPVPGEPVLAVWSSLDRFVAACGHDQPWVAVPLDQAVDLRERTGALAVVLDPPTLTGQAT